MISSGRPQNKEIHCFNCSCLFFAASQTGLVEDAGQSLLMAEDVDGSVLLVCGAALLVLSDVISFSWYKRAIGWFVFPVMVWISADQISPSAPLLFIKTFNHSKLPLYPGCVIMDEYYISDLDSLFIISSNLMSLSQCSKVLLFLSSPKVFNNKCLSSCLPLQIRQISKIRVIMFI